MNLFADEPVFADEPKLPTTVEIASSGESALRVTGATGDAERDWRLVHKLARALTAGEATLPGIETAIPTYDAVLVEFDAMLLDATTVRGAIAAALEGIDVDAPLKAAPRRFRVPVRYGGEHGPDLVEVAALAGLRPEEVVEAHAAPEYTIRCLGAPGGSPMLDGPDLGIPVPRLRSPRAHVRQGVVSLAGRQATITPAAAPGGWMLIGHTPLTVLDLAGSPFVPYEPGDTIRFHPISDEEHAALRGRRLAPEETE